MKSSLNNAMFHISQERTMRSFRRACTAIVLIGIFCLLTTDARAALDAKGTQEVSALLGFVGNSHCIFIRNGKSYDAAEARAHLQTKLNYLLARDLINSADQFIERAGSKSSFSGKPYLVNCDGKERLAADWLTEELRRLRQMQP
jgi:hypothetical protein